MAVETFGKHQSMLVSDLSEFNATEDLPEKGEPYQAVMAGLL